MKTGITMPPTISAANTIGSGTTVMKAQSTSTAATTTEAPSIRCRGERAASSSAPMSGAAITLGAVSTAISAPPSATFCSWIAAASARATPAPPETRRIGTAAARYVSSARRALIHRALQVRPTGCSVGCRGARAATRHHGRRGPRDGCRGPPAARPEARNGPVHAARRQAGGRRGAPRGARAGAGGGGAAARRSVGARATSAASSPTRRTSPATRSWPTCSG